MAWSRWLAPLSCLMVVAGCATAPSPAPAPPPEVASVPAPDWSPALPPFAVFATAWADDPANHAFQDRDEYLLWVRRFYEGYNLVPGWLDMSRDVLARVPPANRDETARRLRALGIRIGAEWAKDNRVRRIITRHAAVWRDALFEALTQDDLHDYLGRVEADVDALLAGELDADVIHFERYYVDDFDF